MVDAQDARLPTVEQARDALDYDPLTGRLVWKWRPNISASRNRLFVGKDAGRLEGRGYRQVTINGKAVQAHRLIWLMVHGLWPDQELDHVNGVRHDNRLANLRLASRQQNTWNTVVRKDSTNGHKGVTWNKHNAKWEASIRVAGKRVYLGLHATAELAHQAYLEAAVRIRGTETVRYDASRGCR